MDIKTKPCATKTFQNDLVVMHKKPNVTFTLDQPAYMGMFESICFDDSNK